MSPVLNFLRVSERFDPQTLANLTLAHDRVCTFFGCRDKPFMREVIAAEIIAFANRYGSNPELLYREAVKVLKAKMPASVSFPGRDTGAKVPAALVGRPPLDQ